MEEIQYKGFTIEILQDENPENPRTGWDNSTAMICFHKRYSLGDTKHDIKHQDCASWSEMEEAIIKRFKPVIIKPVFMLDHSGITISTTDFMDRWDSSQIGFVLMTRKSAVETYGEKRITAAVKKKAEKLLDAEVETYDAYLRGDVYGYRVLDSDGNEIDSCWGYFGYDHEKSGLLESAYHSIEQDLKRERVLK